MNPRCSFLHRSAISAVLSLVAPVLIAGGPTTFVPTQLVSPSGTAGESYGGSMTIGSGVIGVGAEFASSFMQPTGLVYTYNAPSGAFRGNIFPPEPEDSSAFGSAIDIFGDFVLVGSRLDDAGANQVGQAHLYELSSSSHLRTIRASNGQPLDNFGLSVAMNSTLLLAGAPVPDNGNGTRGRVYAYLLDSDSETELLSFIPANGTEDTRFGQSVACTEVAAVIGAPGNPSIESGVGAAYVYSLQTALPVYRLVPDIQTLNNRFGQSVAIEDGLIAVGAPGEQRNPSGPRGAVYLYDLFTGEQLARLTGEGQPTTSAFGQSVSIADGRIVVGDPFDFQAGTSAGAVYVFDASTFEQVQKLVPDALMPRQLLGWQVAAGEGLVGVSGPGEAIQLGQAYIYEELCVADFNRDRVTNVLDVVAFITNWNASGQGADFNGDGTVNILDVVAFISLWNLGCT